MVKKEVVLEPPSPMDRRILRVGLVVEKVQMVLCIDLVQDGVHGSECRVEMSKDGSVDI